MNPFQNASDDQLALMGCIVALVASIGILYLSYFLGPASRQDEAISRTGKPMSPNEIGQHSGPIRRDRAA